MSVVLTWLGRSDREKTKNQTVRIATLMNVLTGQIQEYEQHIGLNSKSTSWARKPVNNEVDARSFFIECPPNDKINLYSVEYTTWSEDKVQQNYKRQGM